MGVLGGKNSRPQGGVILTTLQRMDNREYGSLTKKGAVLTREAMNGACYYCRRDSACFQMKDAKSVRSREKKSRRKQWAPAEPEEVYTSCWGGTWGGGPITGTSMNRGSLRNLPPL